jgi:hypothetical protein
VIAANAAIGFSSENASERLIRRLSKPIEHEAHVLRSGTLQTIASRGVVPGDILVLGPSAVVAADARIIEADELSVDESRPWETTYWANPPRGYAPEHVVATDVRRANLARLRAPAP